jgi:lactate permease
MCTRRSTPAWGEDLFIVVWTQNYDQLGPIGSTLVAALPIVLLLGLLASGRVSAAAAAAIGLAAAMLVAVFAFTPPEAQAAGPEGRAAWALTVFAAAANGAAFGLFPIGWIVLTAIFLYTLTVDTGQFEIVKHSVMALSDDRRLQALLIAFCFGAFIEGAAGFGTPVAISAALLVGAGFRPLHAAGLALIANTSPVAFGALGTPIVTLANITGLSERDLSAMAGRQLPFFSLLVPVVLVWTLAGWRAALEVWPALVVCGGSFALVQFLVANYHGPWLVDVAGGLVSMFALAFFLRFWRPKKPWRFADEAAPSSSPPDAQKWATVHRYSRAQQAAAWTPWILLTALVFLWGVPQVKEVLGVPNAAQRQAFDRGPDVLAVQPTVISIKVPRLHRLVARAEPVVVGREVEKAIYELNWASATGTGILLAALVSACWLGVNVRRFLTLFALTCRRMAWPLITIACMLAIAFTTRYSGMDASLGLAFTRAGWIYPLCSALLGWLGVALTGSDTSSNALFGSLQTITARRLVHQGILSLGEQQAMILLATANSTGGVMGKMIDAQSIVVSAAATQQPGHEGAILRFVFWHSVILAVLMGGLVMVQAHWWPAMIP